jgi:acetyl-CoA acetyltransferase
MGITAENVAKKLRASRREDQDKFAYRLAAEGEGRARSRPRRFKDEIVPVKARCRSTPRASQGLPGLHRRRALPRADTTLEGLAKLPPAFAQGGSVTAGNASPMSDGAAAALVMSSGQGQGARRQAARATSGRS